MPNTQRDGLPALAGASGSVGCSYLEKPQKAVKIGCKNPPVNVVPPDDPRMFMISAVIEAERGPIPCVPETKDAGEVDDVGNAAGLRLHARFPIEAVGP